MQTSQRVQKAKGCCFLSIKAIELYPKIRMQYMRQTWGFIIYVLGLNWECHANTKYTHHLNVIERETENVF